MQNSETLRRGYDIKPPNVKMIKIFINSEEKIAYEGETVLSVLMAHGLKDISKNDHEQVVGAYCGMGICYCCTVSVDQRKRRACKTVVHDGMNIDTTVNTYDLVQDYK